MTLAHAPFVTLERTAALIDGVVSETLGIQADAKANAQANAQANKQTADPLRHALERVFAHDCAVLTDKLNAAPMAHLAAFAGLLGASREPATPAVAPLAFTAAQAGPDAPTPIAPKYTEVAAPPSAASTATTTATATATAATAQPVVFQTLADLDVLRADAVRAVWIDAHAGTLADASATVSPQGMQEGETLATHALPLVRALHIGHRAFFCAPDLAGFALDVQIASALSPGEATRQPLALQWGIGGPEGFVPFDPLSDTTHGFTRSGSVTFGAPPVKWQAAKLHGIESGWLACRLQADSAAGPTLTALALSADRTLTAATLDAASSNRMPVDLTRDFYPFGERPRFNDVLYLASKAFAVAGARVVLSVDLTNPADAAPEASPIPPVSRDGAPHVIWEAHTASGWRPASIDDGTHGFTNNGAVTVAVPADAAPATVNGVAGGWLRARLASGSYRVANGRDGLAGNNAVPMDAPPSIARIGLSMSLHAGPVAPEEVIVENGLTWARPLLAETGERAACQPFPPLDQGARALYVGLRASPGQLAGHILGVYAGMAQHGVRAICRDDSADTHPPRWQIASDVQWRDCEAIDTTGGLRHPGFVQVTLPREGIAPWRNTLLDADATLLWLRVLFDDAAREMPPLRQIVLNAVAAVQALRFERELLGSATQRPSESFRTARVPVVGEVRVDVRETDTDSPHDWVRWNRVDDFAASSHDARDFTLERIEGIVRFGDGRRGRMPPAGPNNVRISYSAGGGAQGNQPPHAITQMRTTVPYVASASNCDWASGGQDMPDDHAVRRASLARLRHRGRAVCRDDYADLALRASPEVAHAACHGSRDVADPRAEPAIGVVSVVIAPRGATRAPQPTLALLAAVKRYLEARAPAGIELVVAGPLYVQVCVDAEFAIAADASPERVRAACAARFDAYLHPVTGGDAGHGRRFGVEPHASDLYACIDTVDGIDSVRSLRLRFIEPEKGVRARGDFLICAGSHTLRASR